MNQRYQETLDFLFTRLPMFSRIGAAAYKADLGNIISLCNFLGNPQDRFPSIHVAGTNGKGSVSHMLAAVLQTAGYRVGLHTSPHLHDFRERIRINGTMISRDFVVSFTDRIKPCIERDDPSFFEISVAMAFDYFYQEQVDIAIIETGLGGRLDSTNILKPELSIITNIGLDHTNLLGNTLQEIAVEKAGIIKPGVPVVLGEAHALTLPVFEAKAKAMDALLLLASTTREVMEFEWKQDKLEASVAQTGKTDHQHYQLDLAGIYQLKNLLTVLAAVDVLNRLDWHTEPAQVQSGLAQVRRLTGLAGRWDILAHHPLLVADVAHNPDGIRQVLEQVEITDHQQLHLVLGMVNDKEIDRVLELLPRTASYYFTQAAIPRAMPTPELQQKAAAFQLRGNCYPDVNAAVAAARAGGSPGDLILVCGSIFLVAELIPGT